VDEELPLTRAGLDVTWTTDMTPYRERKVRILNGAHTLVVLAAFLSGKDTVLECMQDPLFRGYVETTLQQEILPTLTLPPADVARFAASVLERFENPSIRHRLIDIALNSVSKLEARLLCSVLDNQRKLGVPSPRIAFAMAALLAFYRGQAAPDGSLTGQREQGPYPIRDDARVLEFFRDAWQAVDGGTCSEGFCADLVDRCLGRGDFWGCSLGEECPDFARDVATHLHAICSVGVRAALERAMR
jgi:tagaturonate reductase